MSKEKNIMIVIGKNASDLEIQAAYELQRYIYKISGRMPLVGTEKLDNSNLAFYLGCWSSNPALEDNKYFSLLNKYKRQLKPEGFILYPDKEHNELVILGMASKGVVYGIYDFIESCGVGFNLGGDTVPNTAELKLPTDIILKNPVFSIRGSLPWYNFFNSPTTWNLKDYMSYFDQMVKMKNNFAGFHVYDAEPFAAYLEDDGTYIKGEPLLTTAQSTWGTVPLKTADFGFGTGAFYDREAFGADVAFDGKSREEKIRIQQDLLAEAFKYAKSRGLKVCLGFEISGDLNNTEEQKSFEKRLNHLLKTYPMLDYVWLWQPECWCSTQKQEEYYHGAGFQYQPERSAFGTAFREFAGAFSYLADKKQVNEGVRITLYARFAHKLLKKLSPDTKLVLSGWGGDEWLRFSDLYEGLDKTLPSDVIFSALDNIDPMKEKNVSLHYGRVPGREVWPIPWFEYDGDQWCPQPFTKQYEYLLRDAYEKGCEGILGIHWRTRGVEEVAGYTARFSWNKELTFENYYSEYCLGHYGKDLSEKMYDIHTRLQKLGYRWIGGNGQTECGLFRWEKTTHKDKVEQLICIAKEVSDILDKANSGNNFSAVNNLEYLYWNMQWLINYDRTAEVLNEAGEPGTGLKLLIEAELAYKNGDMQKAAEALSGACKLILDSGFEQAMHSFSKTLSNRGELGILATINSKAYVNYSGKVERLRLLASDLGIDINGYKEKKEEASVLKILVPWINTIAADDFVFELLVEGLSERIYLKDVYLNYREAGTKEYTYVNMNRVNQAIYSLKRPDFKENALIEYYFSITTSEGNTLFWPKGAPHKPELLRSIKKFGINSVKCELTENFSVKLQWTKSIDEYSLKYNIYRKLENGDQDGNLIATCTECFYEDYDIQNNIQYHYLIEPVDYNGIKLSNCMMEALVFTDNFPDVKVPALNAISKWLNRVYLSWDSAGPAVKSYKIFKVNGDSGEFEPIESGMIDVSDNGYQTFGCIDEIQGSSRLKYKLVCIGRNGKEYCGSQVVEIIPENSEVKPILSLKLDGSTENPQRYNVLWVTYPMYDRGRKGMAAKLVENGLILEPSPVFNTEFEITISAWINPDKLCGSIFEHGIYGFRGCVFRFENEGLLFYLAGVGEVRAELDTAGKWTHVAAAYDGRQMAVYVNGKTASVKNACGRYTDYSGKIRIGLGLSGLLEDVNIWPVALEAEDIVNIV